MSTVPAIVNNEPLIAPHVSSSRAERSGRRYFAMIFAACFVVYILPFFLMRSGVKTDWTLSYWGSVIETSYHDEHQDADVVVFGDSTAATNFDPVRMGRDLGMKVIVLPNVSTSLPVTGYDPLERYLRVNKPPRLIVFYFSGWNLDFMHNPFTQIVEEGEEMLLLHSSWPELLHYARAKPRKILMFPLHFYASTNHIGDVLYFRDHDRPTLALGHITHLSHSETMRASCKLDSRAANGADASAREGVSRFTTTTTQTLTFISPLPNCRHIELVRDVPHPGLDIPPVQVLPARYFREDGWQAHMLTSRIGPSTDYLETVIRQKLAGSSAGVLAH